jgi:hypothetical protein
VENDTKPKTIERDFWDQIAGLGRYLREWIPTVLGYLFIWAWLGYYKNIRLYMAPHLTRVLMVVATIEFSALSVEKLGAMIAEKLLAIHLATDHYPHSGIHLWIDSIVNQIQKRASDLPTVVALTSVATLITAFIVYRHHHLMTERVQQHLEFLDALREITTEATRIVVSPSDQKEATVFIERVLQTLVEATMKLKGLAIESSDLAAGASKHSQSGLKRITTLMETDENDVGWCFKLRLDRQWPQKTYKDGLQLPSKSAAGKALEKPQQGGEKGNGLIYIPWTRFPHGTRHLIFEKKPRIEYVPDAYVDLGGEGEPAPVSLICTEVAVQEQATSRYVLCLDSNKWKCFNEMDFHAAHLMGSMIGMVLAELHHKAAKA